MERRGKVRTWDAAPWDAAPWDAAPWDASLGAKGTTGKVKYFLRHQNSPIYL
jgi:hypothetical protein